jgi:hypothetical protein
MKKSSCMILAAVVFATLFSISSAAPQAAAVIVTGIVKDSATAQPIAQATVLLVATDLVTLMTNPNLSNMKFDTVYTSADGSFSHSIQVSATQNIIGWMVTKTGYQMKYSLYPVTSTTTTIDLSTIKLAAISQTVNDTVTVSGTVVDSVTGLPLQNAFIVMTGLASLDTAGNTVFTAANGTFSKKVTISNAANLRALIYVVTKTGYNPGGGQTLITGKTLNVGTIRLKPTNITSLNVSRPVAPRANLNNVKVYSLRGQLLYSGHAVPSNLLSKRQGPAIVDLRHSDGSAEKIKAVSVK